MFSGLYLVNVSYCHYGNICSFFMYLFFDNCALRLLIFVDMKGKIRVYCRLRPLSNKEISDRERNALRNVDEFTVEHTWKDDKRKQHLYDRVFDGHATQDDVFEDTKASLTEFCVVDCDMYSH